MADNNKRRRIKPNNKILKRMQRKLWLVFGVVCILFVILIGRVMFIQYTSGDKYEKIILAQQHYDSTIIPFQRGDIIDARGTVLATSVDVYNVILDSKVLNAKESKKPGTIASTVKLVTECFEEIDEDKIKKQLSDNPGSQYFILAKKVSYEEMAKFEEIKEDEAHKGSIFGIWFEKEYIRQYPYGTLAASTIGYASSGNVGVIGLENKYSNVLNGVNGRTYGYLNSDSNLEQTTVDATNGSNIVLSLDVNIQTIAEKAVADWNQKTMEEWNAEHPDEPEAFGSLHTAVLVMNPNNGEVLAMAQYPSFDLNNPRDLSTYYSEEDISAMTEDEKMDRLNQIWQNFCITYTYEPGSTFKPFTVAMGLETGALNGDETYFCDGGEQIADYFVHCVNRNGHGQQTIADALSNSCNDAMMQMSYDIGATTFAEYQSIFGFGQKTGIDLTGEASTAGLIYSQADLAKTLNLATNSFGQNFNTTMIQLGTGFCSLVNGGYLYEPHLVTKITDSSGNTIQDIEPTVLKRTISDETGELLKGYLEYVVAEGTGKATRVDGYRIGGKTGTAEKLPRGNHKYLVSFIGFAPVDNPQVVVYVIIDEPGVGAIGNNQAHSSFAQEICHEIFKQILPYMGVESSLSEEEEAEAAASLTEQAQAPVEEATDDTPETEAPTANPEAVPEPEVEEENN
ncbi:MAG: penicillin-binding protein 2 [Pseudobutyrivibrio sp.]|nr:penicillin-binding protein 2 [Pseudobutyrivibrio sp.]